MGHPPSYHIIGVAEIYKDLVQRFPTQVRGILKEVGLQDVHPCSYPISESMHNVVELDETFQVLVNYDIDYFPKHLHQTGFTLLAFDLR